MLICPFGSLLIIPMFTDIIDGSSVVDFICFFSCFICSERCLVRDKVTEASRTAASLAVTSGLQGELTASKKLHERNSWENLLTS